MDLLGGPYLLSGVVADSVKTYYNRMMETSTATPLQKGPLLEDPPAPGAPRKVHFRNYDIILAVIVTLLSYAFAWTISYGIDTGTWALPLIMSVVWVVPLMIFSVTAVDKKLVRWITLGAFMPGIFFTVTFLHGVILLLAGLLGMSSMLRARSTMFNGRTIRISPALHTTVGTLIFAVAMLVASQYYAEVSNMPTQELLPRVSTVYGVDQVIASMVGTVEDRDITVDEFLVEKSGMGSEAQNIQPPEGENSGLVQQIANSFELNAETTASLKALAAQGQGQADDVVVATMRSNLATSLGTQLEGTESMIDVMNRYIDAQVQSYIVKNAFFAHSLAEFLALFLFVTVLSVGALWKYIWIWATQFIFFALRHWKIIRVTVVQREVETLKM